MAEKFLFSKGFEVFSTEEYAVANPIARREYSETYRLTRRKDGRPFLMKVYLADNMPQDLKFGNEPRLISYLNTSGISSLLSINSWGEFRTQEGKLFPYVISDYFERGLLSDRLLTDGPMSALESIGICLDIAGILLNLRTPDGGNFVHCDVCPDNIMFGRNENGDLHAHLIDNDHIVHLNGRTAPENWWEDVDLRYTAPEAFCSEGVKRNSDVYSLGVILYRCYYGRYPWKFDRERYGKLDWRKKMGVLMNARNEDFPEDGRKDDRWSPLVRTLAEKMTTFDYDEREFTEELRPLLLETWQMLVAAKTAILTAGPSEDPLAAYSRTLGYLDSPERNGLYGEEDGDGPSEPQAGKATDLPAEESDGGTGSSAQKIETSGADDSEFTNAELGYTPLVKMHAPDAAGFRDVAGMEKLKEQMQKKLLYFLKNPLLAHQYKIDLPNGMLLYGPPGCGKTFFAEKFAEESGFNYAVVKASDLGSTWVHGSQGKIGLLFKEARAKSPCIICLDEFDAFAPKRETITNSSLSGEVNEFLSQLNNCGRDRIFVIATTNNPEIIDPAMLRSGRIDRCVYIPAPDSQARRAVFRLCVEKRPHDGDIDYKLLAARTEGYVTSDICGIVNDAAINAAYARTKISMAMLMQAIDNWKPTVSKAVLEKHEEIRRRMESEVTAEIPVPINDKILN